MKIKFFQNFKFLKLLIYTRLVKAILSEQISSFDNSNRNNNIYRNNKYHDIKIQDHNDQNLPLDSDYQDVESPQNYFIKQDAKYFRDIRTRQSRASNYLITLKYNITIEDNCDFYYNVNSKDNYAENYVLGVINHGYLFPKVQDNMNKPSLDYGYDDDLKLDVSAEDAVVTFMGCYEPPRQLKSLTLRIEIYYNNKFYEHVNDNIYDYENDDGSHEKVYSLNDEEITTLAKQIKKDLVSLTPTDIRIISGNDIKISMEILNSNKINNQNPTNIAYASILVTIVATIISTLLFIILFCICKNKCFYKHDLSINSDTNSSCQNDKPESFQMTTLIKDDKNVVYHDIQVPKYTQIENDRLHETSTLMNGSTDGVVFREPSLRDGMHSKVHSIASNRVPVKSFQSSKSNVVNDYDKSLVNQDSLYDKAIVYRDSFAHSVFGNEVDENNTYSNPETNKNQTKYTSQSQTILSTQSQDLEDSLAEEINLDGICDKYKPKYVSNKSINKEKSINSLDSRYKSLTSSVRKFSSNKKQKVSERDSFKHDSGSVRELKNKFESSKVEEF